MDKPPYRVPTMAEIAAVEPNGLTVASTFSGAGGSSLGYRMAGFKVVYANEFVEAARDTYLANAPDYVVMDSRDIRVVTGNEIREMVGEVDLLDGSPPCAAFSTAGKGSKEWGKQRSYSDTEQRVDDLFFEFVRVLRDLQPRAFIAENVAGLVKGKAKGYFKLILAAMKDCGYRVEARVLDAAWLGVPQARTRLIFVGTRHDQPFAPAFPKPFAYQYSVANAICPNGSTGVEVVREDPETGYLLSIVRHEHLYSLWRELPLGTNPTKLEFPGQKAPPMFNLVRIDPSRPSPAIAASWGSTSIASITHWEQPRKLSLPEVRALCSFPEDFVLTGSYKQRWERMGRAVPPLMMKAVASAVRDAMLAQQAVA